MNATEVKNSAAPQGIEGGAKLRGELALRVLSRFADAWQATSGAVGLPTPTLAGLLGSNPFGVHLKSLLLLRSSEASEEALMASSLKDLVAAAVSGDRAVRQRYAGWIAAARNALQNYCNPDLERVEKAVSAEHEALKKLKKSAPAPDAEVKAASKGLAEDAKAVRSIRKGKGSRSSSKPPTADSGVGQIVAELLARLDVVEEVAYFAAVVRLAQVTRSRGSRGSASKSASASASAASQSAAAPPSLASVANGASSVAALSKLLSMGLSQVRGLSKRTDTCPKALGIIVCDDVAPGNSSHTDASTFGRRFLLRPSTMTLERGPGFRLDAFEVLGKALEAAVKVLRNLRTDRDKCRTYVFQALDALAEAFASNANANAGAGANAGANASANAKANVDKVVNSKDGTHSYREGDAEALGRLGLGPAGAAVGGAGSRSGSRRGSRVQVVQVRDDPYMKGCFGCLVGIEACECCMECGEYGMDIADFN